MTTSTPKKGTVPPSDWQERFLKALALYGNVSKAAKAARVSRNFLYAQRKEDKAFDAHWTEALEVAADSLEAEAWRRATRGVKRKKGVYFYGKQIATEVVTEYSDALLMFLLKATRPEKFRERMQHQHTGPNGEAILLQFTDAVAKIYGDDVEER